MEARTDSNYLLPWHVYDPLNPFNDLAATISDCRPLREFATETLREMKIALMTWAEQQRKVYELSTSTLQQQGMITSNDPWSRSRQEMYLTFILDAESLVKLSETEKQKIQWKGIRIEWSLKAAREAQYQPKIWPISSGTLQAFEKTELTGPSTKFKDGHAEYSLQVDRLRQCCGEMTSFVVDIVVTMF